MLWTEAEADQRRRADFPIIGQLLIGLELFHGGDGIVAPFAVDVAFEVAFISKRLLNFLIARGVRMRWVRRTSPFGPSYTAARGGGAFVRRLRWRGGS